MRKYFALAALLISTLSSCITVQAESTDQRYYALLADYRNILIVATGYKKSCDPQPLSSTCHAHVEFIQKLDKAVGATIDNAAVFRKAGQSASVALAVSAGQEALTALTQYLIKAKGVDHAER